MIRIGLGAWRIMPRPLKCWDRRLLSQTSSHPEYREAFVLDPSVDLIAFLTQRLAEGSEAYRQLVHPSSTHVVSAYSHYLYTHQQYNYNDLGEFSFHLFAAQCLPPPPTATTTAHLISASASGSSSRHSVMLWPDQVLIESLLPEDVPAVARYIIQKTPHCQSALNTLQKEINADSTISSLPGLTAIAKVTAAHSVVQAKRSLDLLRTAFAQPPSSATITTSTSTSGGGDRVGRCEEVRFVLAVDAGTRRHSAANVTLLPCGDSYETVWNEKQAIRIAEAHCVAAIP
eukprot:scaffold4140_cov178-Ochromonas_danica.AAC.4